MEDLLYKEIESPIHEINDPEIKAFGVKLFVKREDLIHPIISGNKWRKLKYNILEARTLKKKTLITFGGAYSNHILAVAGAGEKFGFKTIGIIRGEEHLPLNDVLAQASSMGMSLQYIDRNTYRDKNSPSFLSKIKDNHPDSYLLPEGGTNKLAVKGCKEILENEVNHEFTHVCCAVGTGGTISGLILSEKHTYSVVGIPVLKGAQFLYDEIQLLLNKFTSQKTRPWELALDYHFGGYAKKKQPLVDFINDFIQRNNFKIEHVYTGKLFYGVYDMIKKGMIPQGSKVLIIHTGGIVPSVAK